jgi:hypothetical protein
VRRCDLARTFSWPSGTPPAGRLQFVPPRPRQPYRLRDYLAARSKGRELWSTLERWVFDAVAFERHSTKSVRQSRFSPRRNRCPAVDRHGRPFTGREHDAVRNRRRRRAAPRLFEDRAPRRRDQRTAKPAAIVGCVRQAPADRTCLYRRCQEHFVATTTRVPARGVHDQGTRWPSSGATRMTRHRRQSRRAPPSSQSTPAPARPQRIEGIRSAALEQPANRTRRLRDAWAGCRAGSPSVQR